MTIASASISAAPAWVPEEQTNPKTVVPSFESVNPQQDCVELSPTNWKWRIVLICAMTIVPPLQFGSWFSTSLGLATHMSELDHFNVAGIGLILCMAFGVAVYALRKTPNVGHLMLTAGLMFAIIGALLPLA